MADEKAGSSGGGEVDGAADNNANREKVVRPRPFHGRTTGPTRRSTKGQWTPEEDAVLCKAVQNYNGKNWKKIAECFPDRTDVQCLHRWQKVLNPELVKGPWTKQEDDTIIDMVNKHGAKKWSIIAKALPGRIGKQCRERWHNHLNPAINKQAWTQEEELALIQAHKIYGNKWAELTKFLPGRTDNAIKNHWNSSVKKKLDFYVTSGLLEQFPGPSCTENSSHCMSLSSDGNQQNSNECVLKEGVQVEESSGCTQISGQVCCSVSDYDPKTVLVCDNEETRVREFSGEENIQNLNSPAFLEEYNTSLKCCKPVLSEGKVNIGHSINKSNQKLLTEMETCGNLSSQAAGSLEESTSLFLEESQRSSMASEIPEYCQTDDNDAHRPFGSAASFRLNTPSSIRSSDPTDDKHDMPQMDEMPEYCQTDYNHGFNIPNSIRNTDPTDDMHDTSQMDEAQCPCNNLSVNTMFMGFPLDDIAAALPITNVESYANSIIHHSSSQNCERSNIYHPGCSDILYMPCCQGFVNSDLPAMYDGEKILFINNSIGDGINCMPYSELMTHTEEDADKPNQISSGDDESNLVHHLPTLENQADKEPETNDTEMFFSKSPNGSGSILGLKENPIACLEHPNLEALCYEPPRFPSVDIPFVSCDLASSGDLQQAYSPLGIRQLMSSINCPNPCNLWDSSSNESSPDAVLKNAAKTFLNTPSILKKRQRELLSPLHEKSGDKKSARVLNHNSSCIINNRNDSPFKDAMFHETGTFDCFLSSQKNSSIFSPYHQKRKFENSQEQKENIEHNPHESQDGQSDIYLEKVLTNSIHQEDIEEPEQSDAPSKLNSALPEQKSSRILVERDVNNPCFSSPVIDGCFVKSLFKEKRNIDEGKQHHRSIIAPSSSEDGTAKCGSSIDMDFEKLNIFADTPGIKRGIESPSAWKSPWFRNTFLLGPKINEDGIFENLACLLTPGDRTFDAIGLMKHLNEHSAIALAEAEEILTSGKSKKSNDKCSEDANVFTKHTQLQDNEDKENCNPLPPIIMAERRVLDFSGCGSPGKGTGDRSLLEVENILSSSSSHANN